MPTPQLPINGIIGDWESGSGHIPRRGLIRSWLPRIRPTRSVLDSCRGDEVKTLALLVILSGPAQVARRLPVTIEVKRDVEVTHNTEPYESRGKLYLDDVKAKAFRLTKGQRFQMLKIGQEGSCRIRFEEKEYGLTSCPWLEGFRDHQTDVFSIVSEK
jgi:hypothetical protein